MRKMTGPAVWGVLIGHTRTESYTDAEGTTWNDSQSTARITCDENGNVFEVVTQDAWGTTIRTPRLHAC